MSAIYLIRHGQASFAATDYDALSELGVRQSQVLGKALAARCGNVEQVVRGCMRRHAQTTAQALAALPELSAEVRVDAGWDEYDHDDVLAVYEPRYRHLGALSADLAAAPDARVRFQGIFSAAVARWTGGAHDRDYRESWPAFCTRVEAALDRVGAIGRGRTALVFTSGGAISVVCRRLLGLSDAATLGLNWMLANASMTKIIVGRSGLRLSSINEHGHLEGPHAAPALLSYR